ncbi:MAG: PHP domain-containing protein [Candidatus Omnitrophota bacterium]
MMRTADLHLHTCFSDGTYTPEELVREASRSELSCIAIADHDTVEAIEPALAAAKSRELEVIPAIELTADYGGNELHILGYLFDHKNKFLQERLSSLKSDRAERMQKILSKLRDNGVILEAEDVFSFSRVGTVGRLHIAQAMVKRGIVNSTQEAFQRYIGDKSPAYVSGFRSSPQEAIALIRRTGGIAVLAHPYTLSRDEMLTQLLEWGLQGLEAYYPEHSQSQVNFYLKYAQEHNLLVTGGSDCHGDAKPEVRIGTFRIPYALVEKLKEAKRLADGR